MSPESLHQFSRKQLEHLARSQGVSNVRQLRKQDLIEALVKPTASASAARGSQSAKAMRRLKPSANGRAASRPTSTMRRSGKPVVRSIPAANGSRDELRIDAAEGGWIRIAWQISQPTLDRAAAAMGPEWHSAVPVLQLTDVTLSDDGSAHGSSTEVELQPGAPLWYLRAPDPDRMYRVALGYRSPKGRFHLLMRSSPLVPSRDCGKSTAERLADSETPAARADQIAPPVFGGLRLVSNTGDNAREARYFGGDPVPPPLKVDVALVLTGETQPDAKLTLSGKPLAISDDGRFACRCPLEAGRQVLPLVSTAPDGQSESTVVVALDLSTRELEPRVFDPTE